MSPRQRSRVARFESNYERILARISTSSTVSFTSDRSAETISSCIRVGIAIAPLRRLALLELRDHFVDRAGHVEILLRDLVVLAFDDLLEAADRVRNRHVLPLEAG